MKSTLSNLKKHIHKVTFMFDLIIPAILFILISRGKTIASLAIYALVIFVRIVNVLFL